MKKIADKAVPIGELSSINTGSSDKVSPKNLKRTRKEQGEQDSELESEASNAEEEYNEEEKEYSNYNLEESDEDNALEQKSTFALDSMQQSYAAVENKNNFLDAMTMYSRSEAYQKEHKYFNSELSKIQLEELLKTLLNR